MKKVISVLLVLIMLLAVAIPISAESFEGEEFSYEATMTEEEFRTYKPLTSMFSMLRRPSNYHENGYYYTFLKNKNAFGLAEKTYDAILANIQNEPLSGEWNITFETDIFNGMTVNELTSLKDTILGEVLSGGWSFRYDNPSKSDRFTNSVGAWYRYYRYADFTIAKVEITVSLEVHPYFKESLLTERDKKIAEIVAVANRKPTQYLALKYIHDTLDQMAEYDNDNLYASANSEVFLYDHSAFGILSGYNKFLSDKYKYERKGVCESYAKAFMEICQQLYDAPYVGLMTSRTHMWNIVYLDDEWYCVDVTWDDGGGTRVDDKYLLCGDPDIVDGYETDHIPDGDFTESPQYADSKYVFSPVDGDVTFDGQVDILDIIRFKRIQSGAYQKDFYKNADLDGNSTYNALDLAKLKIKVMG